VRVGPALVLAATATACTAAHAGNLGKIGPTYPIAEASFLDHIMARLREKERTGELARLEREAKVRAVQSVTNPNPVAGLRRAWAPRTHYFDPTFTLDRNVVDDKGALLFPAGLRKNPLEVVSMSKHLLFFDARDAAQVAKAREVVDLYHGRVKPILVGGSYLDLAKAWKTPVYFDQEGLLVRKLGITGVPAVVSQEGMRLRIDEVVVR
jgi:conjugal transfer pilus assembly protein TraW